MNNYCEPSRELSWRIWNYISRVYQYSGMRVSEVGLTNHLVFDIVDFSSRNNDIVEVFAWHSEKESIQGADIDLFIEQPGGGFQFYMLQAKVMNQKGRYSGIARWNTYAQYYKLIRAAGHKNAIPLYLLYNGATERSQLGAVEYGMAIAHARSICDFRKRQYDDDDNRKLFFDLLMQEALLKPFSDLFCQKGAPPFGTGPLLNLKEIHRGFPYRKVENSKRAERQQQQSEENEKELQEQEDSANRKGLAPCRIIIYQEGGNG